MPPTADTPLNPRQELFAQALSRGTSVRAAYVEAGYSPRKSSHHMMRLPNVRARVAALMAETAAQSRVSIGQITEGLLEIVERGRAGESAAMLGLARAALMDLAKIHGLLAEGRGSGHTGGDEPQITEIRHIIVDAGVVTELPRVS